MFGGVNQKNPLEFKASEKASLTALGFSMMTKPKFPTALMGDVQPSTLNTIREILLKQGPKCRVAALASVGIFTAGSLFGKDVVDKSMMFSGFVVDAAEKLSDVGTISTVSIPIQRLSSPECAAMIKAAGDQFDALSTQLGNYLTEDQHAMLKSWLCWPTARLLETSAETLKTFKKEEAVANSMVLWNYLSSYFPLPNIVQLEPLRKAADSQAEKLMNDAIAGSISAFREAGGTKIATSVEHDGWIRDAAAALCQAFSHGISISKGSLTVLHPQLFSAVLVSQMVRQQQKLSQATAEGKYPHPWV